MDVTLEGQVTFADVNRLQDILLGRSTFMARPAVVSVASAASRCELVLSTTLLAPLPFPTRVFFLLSPTSPSDNAAFNAQTVGMAAAPGLINAVILEGSQTGTTYSYSGPSDLTLQSVGLSVLLVGVVPVCWCGTSC
jgi:hypothetical protein